MSTTSLPVNSENKQDWRSMLAILFWRVEAETSARQVTRICQVGKALETCDILWPNRLITRDSAMDTRILLELHILVHTTVGGEW